MIFANALATSMARAMAEPLTGGSDNAHPGSDFLLEDGTSFLMLEDGTSTIQLEG